MFLSPTTPVLAPTPAAGAARALRVLAAVATAVLVLLAAAVVLAIMLGWRLQIVKSGSMQPGFPVGSLAVVTPTDPSTVRPGQALVYARGAHSDELVTHRVVRVLTRDDGLYFETRGDANPAADPFLVPAREVRGVVAWTIPRAGYAAEWLGNPRVAAFVVLVPIALLVLEEWRRRRRIGPAPHLFRVPDAP